MKDQFKNQKRLIILTGECLNMILENNDRLPTIQIHPEDLNEFIGVDAYFQLDSKMCFTCIFDHTHLRCCIGDETVHIPIKVNSKRPRWKPWIGY